MDKDNKKFSEYFLAIDSLSKGQKAALKRSAGKTISEAKGEALSAFYTVYPRSESRFGQEERWFLAATLFAGNKTRMVQSVMERPWYDTDFGWTLRKIPIKSSSNGVERRFTALLDNRDYNESLAYKLRQLVALADSRQVPVNWPALLKDLLYWDHPERFVQKRWARNYYSESEERE